MGARERIAVSRISGFRDETAARTGPIGLNPLGDHRYRRYRWRVGWRDNTL
jgi:hypothetical protein